MNNFFSKSIVVFILILFAQVGKGQEPILSWQKLTTDPYLYERMDFEVQIASSFTNPYDASDIALDMVLTSPSSIELKLPCFYVSGNENQSIWNARFLPQEIGNYAFSFQLSKGGQPVVSTEIGQFTVLPSAKNGILHMNTNWTLKYDSGKLFRGIGENVGWEARDWENQKYTYDYFLPKLAKNGVNFFRTWTCIWNLPIEWQIVKDTKFYKKTSEYFNPGGVARMDELIEMIDSLNMHMMLALVPHGALITTGEWPNNPYNVKNGGPAATPTEFFTLDQSKQKFKNTLRYLVARWGYSPGIGAWEFCNEIDNAAYNGGSSLAIPHAAITQWHNEMSAYLNEIDIYNHPITTSISHREIQGLYSVPNIDFNQQHIYRNTSGIASKIEHYQNAYGKPYVIGEFGWDWDWNNVSNENGPDFDYDLKRGLWYGLFTSTPIVPMTWWWEFFDERNMTSYYNSVASISEKMLLYGKGEFKTAAVTANGIEKYAVQCGPNYFIYLLNNTTSQVETVIKLAVDGAGPLNVQTLHPSTNHYSESQEVSVLSGMVDLGKIVLGSKEEIVYIVSVDNESVGISSPYSGHAISLPGIFEAENFDKGIDGSAYHDFDEENSGNNYRQDVGVDIYEKDNGFFIGNIVKGEWLKYTVNFNWSGKYSAEAMVSSDEPGRKFRLLMDGLPISEVVEVPQTGGADNWQTVNIPLTMFQLEKGLKSLSVEFLDSGFLLDYLNFKLEDKAPVVNLVSPDDNMSHTYPAQIKISVEASDDDGAITKVAFYNGSQLLGEVVASPFEWQWDATIGNYQIHAVGTDDSGLISSSDTIYGEVKVFHTVPGTIQAEDYDIGLNGQTYLDLTKGNKFGHYRNDDVDLESCLDEGGGFSVGDFQTGEWLNYTVQVEDSRNYHLDIRVASQMNGGKLSLSVDGVLVASSIAIPNTGGWQKWGTVSVDGIFLSEGEHVITLGSVSQYVNVNSLFFSNMVTSSKQMYKSDIICYPNPVKSILYFTQLPENEHKVQVFNSMGQLVKAEAMSKMSIDVGDLEPGVYSIIIFSPKVETLSRLKFIKFKL